MPDWTDTIANRRNGLVPGFIGKDTDTRGGLDLDPPVADAPGLVERAGRSSVQPFARSMFVLVLDDVFASQLDAIAKVEAIGGRVTLACNTDKLNTAGRMTSAQLAAVASRGHEIAAHSKTHTDMTTQSVADRAIEYTSQSVIEGIIGAGKCRTFVYPNNALNATLVEESYGRFDRVLGGPSNPFSLPISDRAGIMAGRRSWNDSLHALVMACAQRAFLRDEVFIAYTHQTDGSDLSIGVTSAQLDEFLAFADANGVPLVTASEALPAHNPLADPDFNDPALGAWTASGGGGASSVTSQLATATAAPAFTALAMPGTRLLQIVDDGVSAILVRSLPMPLTQLGDPIIASVWAASQRTSGTGLSTLKVEELDQYGTVIATTVGTNLANTVGAIGWTQLKCSFTPNALTRYHRLLISQAVMVGTSWWKHAAAARTRYAFAA